MFKFCFWKRKYCIFERNKADFAVEAGCFGEKSNEVAAKKTYFIGKIHFLNIL